MNTLIIFTAKYLYLIIVLIALIVFAFLPKEQKVKFLKIIIVAIPLSLILTWIGAHLIFDPRPFVVENIKPLIPHSADNGFPSDHTLVSMMAALAVLIFNKKAGAFLASLAILVGISRVLALVHHPLDIIGSIIIAIISIGIGYFAIKKLSNTKTLPLET